MAYGFLFLELLAAIFATIHFKKYAFSKERYFLYFLWFTFVMDSIGVVSKAISGEELTWLYAIFTPTCYIFYFIWYYRVLQRKMFKRTTIAFTVVFIIISLLTYIFPNELTGKGYAFVTGAIGLLVLTFFHFYQLLNSDEVLIVKYKLSFWISTALLLFYMGIIPLILLASYLDIKGTSNAIILLTLNVILYGCYVIGFIWTKKEYNRF